MKEYYKIKSEALISIADAIRSKKETTAVFTPEQMAAEIDGIVMGDNLPNAEDNCFGTQSIAEYGISEAKGRSSFYSSSTYRYLGYQFTVNTNFAVYGFRFFANEARLGTYNFYLYDLSNGKEVAQLTNVSVLTESVWTEGLLDSPINLTNGNTYVVCSRHTTQAGNCIISSTGIGHTHNPKITFVNTVYGSAYPPTEITGNGKNSAVDIIIGPVITESVIAEYKIQAATMRDIANEIQRITGTENEMTISQMLTSLQSIQLQDKSVTPTAEVQTITPDDGYYGLSSVTVGAITEENEAVTEIVNEKMEVVANDTY